MAKELKNSQLQIRISPEEKARLQKMARAAGVPVSEWVLGKLFPKLNEEFQKLTSALNGSGDERFVLAELNDFLEQLSPSEFEVATDTLPATRLTPYFSNYLAAMVEHAAMRKGIRSPVWTKEVPALEKPVFGTELKNLRLHLLLNSPPSFRSRNIFIDSTVGDRI